MRVLVCGGRDFNDHHKVFQTLADIQDEMPINCIISGGAKGADKLGERFAKDRGIELDIYPAQWNVYGRSAGFRRNTQMLVEGKPDLVLAFPGGRGTDMMCQIASDAGVEVRKVK